MTTISETSLIVLMFLASAGPTTAFIFYIRFLLERQDKRNWRDVAEQRERECREWRDSNRRQRQQIVELAKKVKGFDGRGE